MRAPSLILPAALLCLGAVSAAETPPQPPHLAALLGAGDSLRAPQLTSAVRPNVPWAALEAGVSGPVRLRVRVDSLGIVDSVVVVEGDRRVTASAVSAALWCLFRAQPGGGWSDLSVGLPSRGDADPLSPDLVGMAREAEASGDLRGAIDAWTGAIARVGRHPSLADDHVIRARILALAARMPKPPAVPGLAEGPVRGARNALERSMARAVSLDAVAALNDALAIAPWYAEGYRWRASAEAGCGRIEDARRSLLLYRLAAPDSAAQALANRALSALARSDTLAASQMLKY